MTGSSEPSAPRTDAERIARRFALVHQYRANVAFLMGDRARAISVLEKALELEPDNALYKSNFAHLRTEGSGGGPQPNAQPAAKPPAP